MKELISTVNEIVKYGLQSSLAVTDKEKLLERNLVKVYDLYFDIEYNFDETDYQEFDKSQFPDIRQNIESNFRDFGLYKSNINSNDLDNTEDNAIGDAVDDLNDIIIDLLEIRWRIQHNSVADGLWYFQFIFREHTQQHIINLLSFMKHKNE